jgi:hypothetical protein
MRGTRKNYRKRREKQENEIGRGGKRGVGETE